VAKCTSAIDDFQMPGPSSPTKTSEPIEAES
jgi:hypothetical protein